MWSLTPLVALVLALFVAQPPPVLPTPPASARLPAASVVAAALAAPLADPSLGGGVRGEVLDAGTGAVVWQREANSPLIPASVVKLTTAAAALTVLGPADRPQTLLLSGGRIARGTLTGDLVLRGGGDVLLSTRDAGAWPARATVGELAAQLASDGVRRVTGRLVADGSAFTGQRLGPGWNAGYVSGGSIAPVTGLELDEGGGPFGRADQSGDPALRAAAALRTALTAAGITVAGPTVTGTAPAGATTVATVAGPPVEVAVEEMLQDSDNDMAESLGRQVAVRTGREPSFGGAAAAVRAAVERLGVPVAGLALSDASGLSRDDAVAPATLAALMRLAAVTPLLRPLLAGLSTAGFDGTLAGRYRRGPQQAGAGEVHAKTGTLRGVASLAGSVVDADGRQLLFVWISNQAVGRDASELSFDRAAAALALL